MIGLLLIYFIGKAYYDLAGQHEKSKWGFAVLGVVAYYVGTFIGQVMVGIVYELGLNKSVHNISGVALGIMAFPAGLLSCWGLYRILKWQWSKSAAAFQDDDLLDGDLRR